jgi:mRNA interferase RelE/StbE
MAAVRMIATSPAGGEPLARELEGMRTCCVGRFRIVYTVDQNARVIRVMAVGHRASVYEEPIERVCRKGSVSGVLSRLRPSACPSQTGWSPRISVKTLACFSADCLVILPSYEYPKSRR